MKASPKPSPPPSPGRKDSDDEDNNKAGGGGCPIPITGPVIVNKSVPYTTFVVPDFLAFRSLADGMGPLWSIRYAKANVFSWDQPPNPQIKSSSFNLVKVFAVFEDIPGEVMYDVLHDPMYRKEWDEGMIKGCNICQLDANNDVGYYCVKTPSPSSNRDFCNQRAWLQTATNEYIILNTSVVHPDCPVVKGVVRAFSYISGYLIRPWPAGGCSMTYLTQSNPRGWLPSSLMNSLTAKLAPSLMGKLKLAGQKYPAWKAAHKPEEVPWRTPPVEWGATVEDVTPEWVTNYTATNLGGNPASPGMSPQASPKAQK